MFFFAIFEIPREGCASKSQRLTKFLLSQVCPPLSTHTPAEGVQPLDFDASLYSLCPGYKCVTLKRVFRVKGCVKVQGLYVLSCTITNAYSEGPIAVTVLNFPSIVVEWAAERKLVALCLWFRFVYVYPHQFTANEPLEYGNVAS
jgi:hypothetical protein